VNQSKQSSAFDGKYGRYNASAMLTRHHSNLFRLLVLVAILAACAPSTPANPTVTAIVSGPSALSLAVAANDFAVGQPRVPFVLFVGSQPIADAQSVAVTVFDLAGGTPVPGWSGLAQSYNDYEVPYWVAYPEVPHAGYWGLGAVVTLADGSQLPGQFTFEALADPSAPAVGEVPPAIQNRILDDQHELAAISSDPTPDPELYQLTIADALESGRPSIITFATPGFCESRLCAPVVNSLKALYPEYAAQVNFIHVEIYESFDPLTYGPEMDQWGLPSEPWTFVLDDAGTVVARLAGPVSPQELEAALAPVVGG
jgi:hypothetical protein